MKILVYIMCFLMLMTTAHAAVRFEGVTLGAIGGSAVVAADYTPATVDVYIHSNPSQYPIRIGIYKKTATNEGSLITNGTVTFSAGLTGIQSGSFSNCESLTAGDYYIALTHEYYVDIKTKGSNTLRRGTDDAWTSMPSSLPTSNVAEVAEGEYLIRVKNASGSILIGKSDFNDNDGYGSVGDGDGIGWYENGYTRVTL